ncbi:MAG: phosphatidylglycerol lysyltransferase [Spirochaetia bacterium]|nr:phosphatidylglycerol lysyltransferase [Spirochaetia bacterium]
MLKELAVIIAFTIAFAILVWRKNGKIRLLSPFIITVCIIFFNLLNPVGKVLFRIGSFPITATAFGIGLRKGLILWDMVLISKLIISRNLPVPGKAGKLVKSMFYYFDSITSERIKFKPGRIIETIDNRLLECYKDIDMDTLFDDVYNSYKKMIISASGWRKVFAADGDENSMNKELSEADSVIAAGIGYIFSKWALSKGCKTVAIARDARPTGEAICQIVANAAQQLGLSIQYLAIAAAPEIMAYVKNSEELDGFIYISASHNPAGHNGVKFGLGDGSVLGGSDAADVIARFKAFMEDKSNYQTLVQILNNSKGTPLPASEFYKAKALEAYLKFNLATAFATEEELEAFKKAEKPAVVADMNGSARCLSIDRQFFDTLGIEYSFINDTAGEIAHGILPEGRNLNYAAGHLEKLHTQDKRFTIGYVPDNDGDRGNLVLLDKNGKALIPDAQTVFVLACTAELTFMQRSGQIAPGRTAVAVNCPTSLRIEQIAQRFGVTVFRAEVGEANVVNLAAKLRKEGYTVRFLGEGSNGGNITHPATVRDPLNTIISIIKYASLTGKSWEEMIAELPQFQTTSTDDALAKMKIQCTDHGKLKLCYEDVFKAEWEEKKAELAEKFGITSWREINTIGTESYEGTGAEARKAGVKGGLKILFSNKEGKDIAFIWMRGSGTEPVFRILADIESSNPEDERYLIQWQHHLVEEADRRAIK